MSQCGAGQLSPTPARCGGSARRGRDRRRPRWWQDQCRRRRVLVRLVLLRGSRRYGTHVATIDLRQDIATLAAALVDVYSESGHETELADAVEVALRALGHLQVDRDGDAVVARTTGGHP